jgi:receptor protein-tyrosine kinase
MKPVNKYYSAILQSQNRDGEPERPDIEVEAQRQPDSPPPPPKPEPHIEKPQPRAAEPRIERAARVQPAEDEYLRDSHAVTPRAPVVPLPVLETVPAAITRAPAIRDICERIAGLTAVEKSTRLAVSGCRPGDGATTVAAALAMDLSQRLGFRTLLVDANLRRPTMHRMFSGARNMPAEIILDGALQIRSTSWHRVDLVTCCCDGEEPPPELFGQFEELFRSYAAVVIDLGVTRLDARMLPLVRPVDPVLLVVKQGQTKRSELATASTALRAANRSVAAVVLNAASKAVAKPLRKLLSHESVVED